MPSSLSAPLIHAWLPTWCRVKVEHRSFITSVSDDLWNRLIKTNYYYAGVRRTHLLKMELYRHMPHFCKVYCTCPIQQVSSSGWRHGFREFVQSEFTSDKLCSLLMGSSQPPSTNVGLLTVVIKASVLHVGLVWTQRATGRNIPVRKRLVNPCICKPICIYTFCIYPLYSF